MKLSYTRFNWRHFIVRNLLDKRITQVNFFKLLFLTSKGFHINSIVNRPLGWKNYRDYLPYAKRPKISLLANSGYWPVLHDKLVFYKFMKGDLPIAELLAVVFRGTISPVQVNFEVPGLIASLKDGKKYVFKPLRGGKGAGVTIVSFDSGYFLVHSRQLNETELQRWLGTLDEFGIFTFYNQHDEIKKIYPESTNTIRMVTFYDFANNAPYISHAYLKIGTSTSKPLDNYSLGGIVATIDLVTGRLSNWLKEDKDGVPNTGSHHPDSKAQIVNFIIPHWEDVKATMLSYLSVNPYLNYVGWDILITNTGFVVVEGNHNPGSDQVLLPYLKDERSRLYFKTLGIV